jgi:hypothetical protein
MGFQGFRAILALCDDQINLVTQQCPNVVDSVRDHGRSLQAETTATTINSKICWQARQQQPSEQGT